MEHLFALRSVKEIRVVSVDMDVAMGSLPWHVLGKSPSKQLMLRPGILRFFKALSLWQLQCWNNDVLALPMLLSSNPRHCFSLMQVVSVLLKFLGGSRVLGQYDKLLMDQRFVVRVHGSRTDIVKSLVTLIKRLSCRHLRLSASLPDHTLDFVDQFRKPLRVIVHHLGGPTTVVPSQVSFVIDLRTHDGPPMLSAGISALVHAREPIRRHHSEFAQDLWHFFELVWGEQSSIFPWFAKCLGRGETETSRNQGVDALEILLQAFRWAEPGIDNNNNSYFRRLRFSEDSDLDEVQRKLHVLDPLFSPVIKKIKKRTKPKKRRSKDKLKTRYSCSLATIKEGQRDCDEDVDVNLVGEHGRLFHSRHLSGFLIPS